jgi:hypothetical protein
VSLIIIVAALIALAFTLSLVPPVPSNSSKTSREWMKHANCAQTSVQNFFVPSNQTISRQTQALCTSCPVKAECLNTAIETDSIGYWGATTTEQRQSRRFRFLYRLQVILTRPRRLSLL